MLGLGLGTRRETGPPLVAPAAPSAPTATLSGLNTADLSVALPSGATSISFYGAADGGQTFNGNTANGSLNTGNLANGVWQFWAAASNAAGSSANSANSSVTRVLPHANVTMWLTYGPVWCFQARNSVATPAAAGDPVGTIVDRATGNWWVAPDDASRGVLQQSAGAYYLDLDGTDDRYFSNTSFGFATTGFTLSLGVRPDGNTSAAVRYLMAGNGTGKLALGVGTTGILAIARENIASASLAGTTVANNTNSVMSMWSAAAASGGNVSIVGRVNGGANATGNLTSTESSTAPGIGGINSSTNSRFPGWLWGVIYANADLSGGAGLAALEGAIDAQTP